MMDDQGRFLWQKTDFFSIDDMEISGAHLVVLDGDTVSVFQARDGKETGRWKIDGLRRGRDHLQTLVQDDDGLIIQFGMITLFSRVPWFASIWVRAASPPCKQRTPNILDRKKRGTGALFDFTEHSILFFRPKAIR